MKHMPRAEVDREIVANAGPWYRIFSTSYKGHVVMSSALAASPLDRESADAAVRLLNAAGKGKR